MKKTIYIFIMAILVSGCATARIAPRPRPPKETSASLYFTRGKTFLYCATPAIISVDSIESVSLAQNAWAIVEVSSGEHSILLRSQNAGQSKNNQKVYLKESESRYYEVYPNPGLMPASLVPISSFAVEPFLLREFTAEQFENAKKSRKNIEVPYYD